jgi:hypothetical protein
MELSHFESQALASAQTNGWLTVSRDIGDEAIAQWQSECERYGHPFAMARPEPTRTSVWFVLPAGREWNSTERRIVDAMLAGAKGYVLSENSLRTFIETDAAGDLMHKLLAVAAH